MRPDSLLAQIIAVLSRRTPAFYLAPGEPETFPDTLASLGRRRNSERKTFGNEIVGDTENLPDRRTEPKGDAGLSDDINYDKGYNDGLRGATDSDGGIQPRIISQSATMSGASIVQMGESVGISLPHPTRRRRGPEDSAASGKDDLVDLPMGAESDPDSPGDPAAEPYVDPRPLGEDLRGMDLRGVSRIGADLVGANLSDADLSGADLREADLRDAELIGADLSGADLSDANLGEANLIGAYLSGADLSGANMSRALLADANLRNAILVGANLQSAILLRADLAGANLIDGHLDNALGLTLEQLQGVLWSENTIWPNDFLAKQIARTSRKLEDGNSEVVVGRGPDRKNQEVLT